MSFTIDKESNQNKTLPIDLDYLCDRYTNIERDITFPSPTLWVLEKHLFYLLKNSVKKTFESKYKMRPDYLSYDEYGTVVLAPLLMYVNGVFNIEEFDLNEVVVPDFSNIIEICSDKFDSKDKTAAELVAVDW